MTKNTYTRYHRYDQYGTKYIKRFENNCPPTNEPVEGYSEWMRGTGPFEAQALKNVTEGLRRACKGVPKTPEQKQKMRDAKLGVPKSQEHKDNMRKSWYRRREQQLNQERYIVDEIQPTSTTSTIQLT